MEVFCGKTDAQPASLATGKVGTTRKFAAIRQREATVIHIVKVYAHTQQPLTAGLLCVHVELG